MTDFVKNFNTVIDTCRDILRKEGITGMDSMKHLTLYILARALDKEECKRLNLDEKFAWEKFLELVKLDKKQHAFDLLYNKDDGGLIATLDDLFGTRNFNFKLNSPDHHASILKHLDKINFKALDGTVDILGTVYENHLGSGSNKSAMRDLGQFFTDRRVCAYMTKLCDPKTFDDGTAESVLDPTMGTGGFLTAYVKFLKEHGATVDWNTMQMDIAGYDIDEFVMSVGLINMYLSTGVIFKRIQHRNSLNLDVGDLDQRLKFKIILANMPFGVKGLIYKDCCKRVKDLGINGTKSEPLFLNLMMAALDEDGRCAVVVPDGVLVNNSNQHNGTRKYLLDNFELKRVIKMKGQFFSNTGIQPSILFFENTGNPTSVVEFWEVEQASDGAIVEKMVLSVRRDKFDEACSLDMRRYQEVAAVANTGGYPMVKLGDVIEFKNGKNIPERDRLESGTYPYYASNGINGFVENSIFEGPSVLLGDQGSAWHRSTHFVEAGSKFYAGNHTIVMKSKDTSLNIKYLYYHLLLNDLQTFNKCAALIPELDKERFYASKLFLPPLTIQQEIVTALELIYNNAATAKAAAASVKSQMAAVVRSVGARGFERKKLGDLYDCPKTIKRFNSGDRDPTGNVPFFNGKWSCPDGTHTDYSFDLNSPYLVMIKDGGGDHNSDTVGMGKFFKVQGKCAITSHNMVLTPKPENGIEYDFIYHYLTMNAKSIRDMATYSINLGGISKESIVNYEIPLPPLPIQHEVLAILNEMEAELATLEQMAAKAEQRAKFVLDGYLTPAPVAQPEPVVAQTQKPKKKIVIRDEE